VRIAFVGCGYVADFYISTLLNHPELENLGFWDRDQARLDRFCAFYRAPRFEALEQLLADPRVELVVNLTNPSSHYQVSKAALEAGKHVYSEKPLAMEYPAALDLVELAERRGLQLAGAPCNMLGESAQTLWKALREQVIGKVRLVYAEIDDGPVPLMDHARWLSESGTPWPAKDEFEVGCTLEHAGYYVGWLASFFGPALRVTSFASELMPDKGIPLDRRAPDLSVGCIEFAGGVVARLTCSLYGTHDHRVRVFGDRGILSVADCWDFGSKVMLSPRTPLRLKAEKYPLAARLVGLGPRALPLVRKPTFRFGGKGANRMDFCRGIAEVAEAVRERRPSRMSARFALHVNEVVLALQDPTGMGAVRTLQSTFEPIEPMEWARAQPVVSRREP
jgi:predicted dehydrogenase